MPMMNNLYCMLVGVHDSYWTHACDVDKLNRLLREKFVELYETPVLENVWFNCSLYPMLLFLLKIIFVVKLIALGPSLIDDRRCL